MDMRFILVGLLVALAVCAAGCTQAPSPGGQTPAPTQQSTPVMTGAATSAATATSAPTSAITQAPTAGALQTLPVGQDLAIQVNRDPLNRDLTVIFNGGRAQGAVRAMEATVVRSDGTTETKQLDSRTGSEVIFKGTRGVDTISVSARLTNGNTYRFFEQSIN